MNFTVKEAKAIIGGLSRPSKMPGFSWSIPAFLCQVGSRLAKVQGSTCSSCYAMKNRYTFRATQDALMRRYLAYRDDPRWDDAMVTVLKSRAVESKGYFRWFDSGDLQSVDMLRRIADVCRRTPNLRHWLPTREVDKVQRFAREGGRIPQNLVVRLSAPMVDGAAPSGWEWASTVHRHRSPIGKVCPAPQQGNNCGGCRACWDRNVPVVSYHWH